MSAGRPVEIYLPCEVFEVEVQVGPREGLSVLEELTLQAVRHEIDRFDDLVHLFQIGYRPMLDLVSDLWRQGHVYIDLVEGRIGLLDHVARQLRENKQELAGGERTVRPIRLLQELVSGRILPFESSPQTGGNNRTAPQVLDYGSFRSALLTAERDPEDGRQEQRAELMEVLGQVVSRWGEGDRHLQVLGANLRVDEVLGPNQVGQRRLLQLSVQCSTSPSGRLEVKVLRPSTLGGRVRRSLELRLADLAEERAEEPFFKFLREQSGGEASAPRESIEQIAAQLLERARALAEPEPDGLSELAMAQAQEQLAGLADLVQEGVAQRQAERVRIRLLGDRDAVDEAIRTAIGDAKTQLVLSCPSIRWSAFSGYLRALEKTVERGVPVFVLWGARTEDTLEPTLRNAFADLEHRPGSRFHWARYPARYNARFCLKDFDFGIFTNLLFLDRTDPAQPSLGAVVRSPEGMKTCLAVQEMLDRVYRILPDNRVSAKLLTRPPTGETAGPPVSLQVPPLPDLRVIAADDRDPVTDGWRQGWHAYARGLSASLDAVGDAGSTVHDGRHRDLLFEVLRDSRRLVVIASEQVTSEALDPRLERALHSAADLGTRLLILHGRIRQQDEAAHERLRKLKRKFPDRVAVVATTCQGGVLIGDDLVLLTGFGLLSRAGHAQPVDHLLLESGLAIRSRDVAAAVTGLVAASSPDAAAFLPRIARPDAVATSERLDQAIREAGRVERRRLLFERLAGLRAERSPRIPEIRLWLEESMAAGSLAEDLEHLVAALPVEERLAAVALCLRQPDPDALDLATKRRWLLWTAADRWHGEMWHEAAVFLAALEEDGVPTPGLPPLRLARLAAARGGGDLEGFDVLLSVPELRDEMDGREAAATTCLALPVLLLSGSRVHATWEWLDHPQPQLPGALQEWSQRICSYWRAWGDLPPSFLSREEISRQAGERARQTREELLAAFDEAHNTNFFFSLGRKAWAYLFHPKGELGRLRPSIESGDVATIRAWLEHHREKRSGPEELMDEATREISAGDPSLRNDRIERDKRKACLQKLHALFAAAGAWVEAQAQANDPMPYTERLQQTRELARELRSAQGAVEALQGAWIREKLFPAPLARRLLADLAPLLRL